MNNRAFSLLEILLVLLIVSIMIFFALGPWETFFKKNRAHRDLERITEILNLARLTALTRQQITQVCGSANQLDCNGQWDRGILLRLANGTILQTLAGISTQATITYKGFMYHHSIEFLPDGQCRQNGTFYYVYHPYQAEITINRAGRIRNQDNF